jgi:hypothetical protein
VFDSDATTLQPGVPYGARGAAPCCLPCCMPAPYHFAALEKRAHLKLCIRRSPDNKMPLKYVILQAIAIMQQHIAGQLIAMCCSG